jgi:hypothetical protein
MQKLSIVVALVAPLAACTLFNAGPDGIGLTESELPNGITLLESDEDTCDGTVRVDQGFIAGGNANEVIIPPGGDVAFEIEEQRVVWTCIDGDSPATEDMVEGPRRTSHVRITRPSEGESFLVECFG